MLATVISDALQAMVSRDAIVYALAAIGINIHFGYTGLLNFGQVGWMAVGAYGMAIGVVNLGLPLWAAVLFACLCSVCFSLLLGLPTLRLRADYLAIVTVAAGELVRIVARAASLADYTGGSAGLPGKTGRGYNTGFYPTDSFQGRFNLGAFTLNGRQMWFFVVGWACVLVVTGLVYLLVNSPWGRVLKAIREDEDAARSLGKSAYSYKMQSLIIGGLIGSLAGMLLALESGSVQPDSYSPPVTYFAWTCLILGGVARVWGPVIGSMIFWFLLSVTNGLLEKFLLGTLSDDQLSQVRFVLVGLGLAALMVFRPQGLFGSREEMALDAR